MKDEEGLALKAPPRGASEEPVTAAQTAEVVEGVENLVIASSSDGTKKRRNEELAKPGTASVSRPESKSGIHNQTKPQPKTKRGSAGGKRRSSNKSRGSVTDESESGPELRRSKRRKSA